MKRVLMAFSMALAMALSVSPMAGASEPTDECYEVWVHFRPTVCATWYNGQLYTSVCPDRWATGCYPVTPISIKGEDA